MAGGTNGTAGLAPLIRVNQQNTDAADESPGNEEAPGDSKGGESLGASDELDEDAFAYGEYP